MYRRILNWQPFMNRVYKHTVSRNSVAMYNNFPVYHQMTMHVLQCFCCSSGAQIRCQVLLFRTVTAMKNVARYV